MNAFILAAALSQAVLVPVPPCRNGVCYLAPRVPVPVIIAQPVIVPQPVRYVVTRQRLKMKCR